MKYLIVFLVAVSFNHSVAAQNLYLNFFSGTSNYQGDLQNKYFTFAQSHPAIGGGIGYDLTDHIFLRAQITFGKISGDDKANDRNKTRNLQFSSSLTDVHIGAEYLFFNMNEKPFSPYVFGGLAVFHFNPYTHDTLGEKIFLQPLSTEGQGFINGRKPYRLTQLAIVMGGGFKIAIGNNLRLGIEIGMRKTFTDYLDDVSTTYVDENALLTNRGPKAVELAFRTDELKTGATYPPQGYIRGDPKQKDWYLFKGITASITLPTKFSKGEAGRNFKFRNKTGCPSRVY